MMRSDEGGAGMYCKVLIIDDEYIMRQGIRHMIEWEKEGYTIVAEASNGEEGIAMIEEYKPDIVLADIVMPVLDGMEFSMVVKNRFPRVKLIILSSYDNFEYVKQTLLNGACDYVLKPSLNPKTLTAVLDKTAAAIPGMCLQKDAELSIREKLGRYLGGYEVDLTQGDFRQRFPYTNCRLLLSNIGTVCECRQKEETELLHFLQDYWQGQADYETETLIVSGKTCLVLLNYRVKDEDAIMQAAKQCAAKLERCEPGCFWVYGEVFGGLSDLQEAYEQACVLAGQKFYYKDTPFLSVSDSRVCKKAERFAYEQYAELLKYHNFNEALKQLEAYAVYMCNCTVDEYLLKNTAKNLIYNFLLEKEKELADWGLPAKRTEIFRKIDKSRYVQDFQCVLQQVLEELGKDCQGAAAGGNIAQIQQYINKHYAENLELAQIAKKFNYNYNYLSTYFNQHMKESFSEYLNRIRIEKACKILKTTSYSIAQVSELVGYSDPSYFSKIFKNQTGRTPSQWKRKGGKQE